MLFYLFIVVLVAPVREVDVVITISGPPVNDGGNKRSFSNINIVFMLSDRIWYLLSYAYC